MRVDFGQEDANQATLHRKKRDQEGQRLANISEAQLGFSGAWQEKEDKYGTVGGLIFPGFFSLKHDFGNESKELLEMPSF